MGESIVYAIKCALIVAAVGLFLVATTALFNGVVTFGSSFGIVTDILGVVSMCLPFNSLHVFTVMFGAFDVVLAWVLARKLYSLNRKGVEST